MSAADYQTLGLSKDANPNLAIIRVAYKKLSLIHHPDKNLENVDEARLRFQAVHDAYESISRMINGDDSAEAKWDEEQKAMEEERAAELADMKAAIQAQHDRIQRELDVVTRIIEEQNRVIQEQAHLLWEEKERLRLQQKAARKAERERVYLEHAAKKKRFELNQEELKNVRKRKQEQEIDQINQMMSRNHLLPFVRNKRPTAPAAEVENPYTSGRGKIHGSAPIPEVTEPASSGRSYYDHRPSSARRNCDRRPASGSGSYDSYRPSSSSGSVFGSCIQHEGRF